MKKFILSYLLTAGVLVLSASTGCTSQAGNTKQEANVEQEKPKGGVLSAADFEKRLKSTPDAQIADVRTPKEFRGGYVKNAMNLDYNSDEFASHMQQLDKKKPVFVYCLSGGRSASAAEEMRKAGFAEVYEMEGGTMAWKKAGLPLEGTKMDAAASGMTDAEYKHLTTSDKLVLVDFNAPWCAPCRKMKPMLEELKTTNSARMNLLVINTDENKTVAGSQNVTALPTLLLYKNGKQVWRHEGYIGKEELEAQINKF